MKTPMKTSLKPKAKILKSKAKSWNVKNKSYDVKYDQKTEKWCCSCPHFFYRISKKNGEWVEQQQGCKHIMCSRIINA